jgi:hypothetical protein|tara:strand:- start:1023 stop:1739 length:717 start_codon:yes stop_codon:yes gene_type:complete
MFIGVFASHATTLLEEDFEGGKLNESKWNAKAEWKLIKPEAKVAKLGTGVVDINGGQANFSKKTDFKNFVFEADFNAKKDGKITGFVFGGQDPDNYYMHQISANGSGHTPNNVRWHTRSKGAWAVDPKPFLGGEKVEPEVWYRSKWIVKDFNFKVWVLESETFWKNPAGAKMRKIGDWTDPKKSFPTGAVGFRSSGGEHMRYDNVLVYDIGDNPHASGTAVDPHGKLAATWASLKTNR